MKELSRYHDQKNKDYDELTLKEKEELKEILKQEIEGKKNE